MTSSATIYSTLGDPNHGGALFTIPPEVRDEIYRLVVRKRYTIYITRPKSDVFVPSRDKHDLAILQVSKAINHEASDILYAESVFRLKMNFSSDEVSSVPAHLANRMTNVELDFQDLAYFPRLFSSSRFQRNVNAICHASNAIFASNDIKRKLLHISFFGCCPDMMEILSSDFSKTLNAFIGFRTVVIEVVSVCSQYLKRVRSMDIEKSSGDLKKETTIAMGQQILDILTPTLGPAETAVHGVVICFVLHPQDYVASSAR